MTIAERLSMTIEQQADFIDDLASRCVMRDGSTAADAYLAITNLEADDLRAIGARLRRIAPHENAIRKMVTQR